MMVSLSLRSLLSFIPLSFDFARSLSITYISWKANRSLHQHGAMHWNEVVILHQEVGVSDLDQNIHMNHVRYVRYGEVLRYYCVVRIGMLQCGAARNKANQEYNRKLK